MPTVIRGGMRFFLPVLCVLLSACGSPSGESNNPAPDCDVDGAATATPEACSPAECASTTPCENLAADDVPPTISLDSATTTTRAEYLLEVSLTDSHQIREAAVSIGGAEPVALTLDGPFGRRTSSATVTLAEGTNTLVITAEDVAGNQNEASFEVLYEPPVDDTLQARFSVPQGTRAGQPATFDAAETVSPPQARLQYRWDFGDGTTGRGLRTSHVFAEPGRYVVELAVADLDTGRTSQFIDVVPIDLSGSAEVRFVTAFVDVTSEGQPVSDARLVVDGEIMARTDASGRAQLDLLVAEFVDIEAQADGFAPLRRRVPIGPDDSHIRFEFELTALSPPTSSQSDDEGFEWLGDGASMQASSGGLVDRDGTPAGASTTVQIDAVDPCSDPEKIPDLPAFDLDAQPVFIDARGGAYLDLSPHVVSDDPTEQVSLTIAICNTDGIDDEVPFWHLEDSGVWVQRGVAAVDADSSASFPISDGGWWAVGPSYPQSREVDVSCATDAGPRACTVRLASPDGRFAATRFVRATSARLSVPAVELRVDATSEDGACTGSATLGADDTSLDLQMDCYGDDFVEIDYQTPEFDITIDSAEPIAGYRFDGERADGVWFDLSFAPNAGIAGSVRLVDAEQNVLAEFPVGGDRAGVGFALPFDGTYFLEVELTSGFGSPLSARLETVPVIDYQNTFSGTWGATADTVEHLVFVDPQRPVMNIFQYGDLRGAAPDFVEFSGEPFRGRATGPGGRGLPVASETGVTELPRGGFWLVRLREPRNTAVRKGDYLLEAVTIDPAEDLQFDNLGRTTPQGAIARLGDHRLFTFDASAGDGLEVALRSSGANAADRLYSAAVRLSRVGTGTTDSPEEVLREYVYFGSTYAYSLDTFSAKLPTTDSYVLEVYHHDYNDFASELGGFELRLDKVTSNTTIIVDDDAACAGVATRSMLAAVAAAPADGTVELCEGDWELEIELPIRTDGVQLVGRGRDLTGLRRVRTLFAADTIEGAIDVLADRVRIADMSVSARSQQPDPASQATLIDIAGDNTTLENLRIRAEGANRNTGVTTSGNRRSAVTVVGTSIENVEAGAEISASTVRFEDNELDVGVLGLYVNGADEILARRNTQPAGRYCYNLSTSATPSRVLVASNTCAVGASSSTGITLQIDGRTTGAAGDFAVRGNDITATGSFSTGLQLFARGSNPEVTVDANRFEVPDAHAILLRNGTIVSAEGRYLLTNNLFVDHGPKGAVVVLHPDRVDALEVFHNTFVARGGTAAVTVDLITRFIGSGVLPLTYRNNIVRGGDGDDVAVGMSRSQSGPYSIEYGDNLLQGLGQPYPGLQNTSSDTDQFGNALLDPSTYKPAASSPAVDAVACDLGVTDAFDGMSRPQGGSCDIGAHEQ